MNHIDLLDLQLPLSLRPNAPVTDDQLIRFSDRNKPYRFERNKEGEIIVMTPVGGIGGTNEAFVASMLFTWAEGDDKGIGFASNTGFNLPDGSCLSPDAAWLPLTRWDSLTLAEQTGFPPVCPDFIIEIRSRSDSRRLLEAKMQLWLDNGAELAWLIDPIDGEVVIYKPDQAPAVLVKPELLEASAPVSGFVLRASRLWVTRT